MTARAIAVRGGLKSTPRELGSKSIEARAGSLALGQNRSRRLEKRFVLRCNIEQRREMSRSGPMDGARLNVEARRGADAVEQCRLGGGHPHLAAPFEAGE